MAYDRNDARGGSRERWRSDDEWRDRDRDRGQGRGDERGFFERAKEEFTNFFGGDEDDRRSHSQERMRPDERSGWGGGFGRDRERGSRWDKDQDRGRGAESGYRPLAGDYGRSDDRGGSGRSNWDRDQYRRTSFAGSSDRSAHHDPHYAEWRQRQLDEIDRDYDDYRRENQSKFESDFGSWRQKRQSKRQVLGQAREQMEVVGSDGEHVGTVDRVTGDRLVLTKSDPEAGGMHHSLSCSDVDRIEGDRLILDCTAEQAKRRWRDDSRERALFEREDQGEAGPHVLDRSFSGTYR